MSNNKWLRIVLPTLLCAIGVFYALMLWFHTYTGDDLVYTLGWHTYYEDITGFPLHVFRHWRGSNGRLANILNPLWLVVTPKWMFAALSAVAMWGVVRGMIWCSRFTLRVALAPILMVAIVVFLFTWWDVMVVYVCALNYVWSVAFVMLFFRIMQWVANRRINNVTLVCFCVFAIVAGGMHEALGVPVLCGIIVYMYIARRSIKVCVAQRWILVAFAIGVAFVFFSPGIWCRFGSGVLSDNVPADIVVMRSAYLTLAMLAWLVVGMMIKPMRDNFKQLIRTPWVIFVVAAVASLPFCAVSGIIGRTGWFSQIFAVIAVFYYYNATGLRVNRRLAAGLSVVLVVLIASHCAVALRQQYIMGRELATMIELYRQSPDGVVYMDYTPDSAQHPWALRKARGVHDPEESYYIETISRYYGSSERPLVVVPKALESIPAYEIEGTISVGNCLVTDAYAGERDGYVVVPFTKDGRQLYLYRPHEIDPDSPTFIPFR